MQVFYRKFYLLNLMSDEFENDFEDEFEDDEAEDDEIENNDAKSLIQTSLQTL